MTLRQMAEQAAIEWLGPRWGDLDAAGALADAIERVAKQFAERGEP